MWVNIGLVKVEQPKQQGKVEIGGFSPYKAEVDLIKTYCRLVVQKETTPFFLLTEFWSSSKEFTLRNFLRGFGQ